MLVVVVGLACVVRCFLHVACWLLVGVGRFLLLVCTMFGVAVCLARVTCYSMLAVRCALFVVCCLCSVLVVCCLVFGFVASRLLFVVSCVLRIL